MALSYRARKRLSLLILLVGMPLYVVVAVTLVNIIGTSFGRPPIWVELAIYVGLGIIWALPFRRVFRGIGQPDPDLTDADLAHPHAKTKTEGRRPSV